MAYDLLPFNGLASNSLFCGRTIVVFEEKHLAEGIPFFVVISDLDRRVNPVYPVNMSGIRVVGAAQHGWSPVTKIWDTFQQGEHKFAIFIDEHDL